MRACVKILAAREGREICTFSAVLPPSCPARTRESSFRLASRGPSSPRRGPTSVPRPARSVFLLVCVLMVIVSLLAWCEHGQRTGEWHDVQILSFFLSYSFSASLVTTSSLGCCFSSAQKRSITCGVIPRRSALPRSRPRPPGRPWIWPLGARSVGTVEVLTDATSPASAAACGLEREPVFGSVVLCCPVVAGWPLVCLGPFFRRLGFFLPLFEALAWGPPAIGASAAAGSSVLMFIKSALYKLDIGKQQMERE